MSGGAFLSYPSHAESSGVPEVGLVTFDATAIKLIELAHRPALHKGNLHSPVTGGPFFSAPDCADPLIGQESKG